MRNRIVALVTALLLFAAVTVARPSRAEATSAWVWAGIAVGVYAVFVIIATAYFFDQPMAQGSDQFQEAEGQRRKVQIQPNCRPSTDGNVALICW